VEHDVSAEITSSLYEAAVEAGLSNNLIMELEKIFGWDVDFVQDIRVGDTFHVIFNDYRVDDKKIADGDILAAEFTTQGNTYRAIRFADAEGNASYYTPEGDSMLGTFLRSPVEFSRISSRFGKRKHPISKKWKAHKGVDYAAARGTPIRATADGNVIHAGNKGGYGKTIVLRHAGRFSTLYAHMNGYAKGIRSGSRVKQGQIIGYVGSTGYSTGPHLHYEFRVDGVHRNPLTYKTPKASSISPDLKNQFLQIAASWTKKLDNVQQNYQIAKAETTNKKI
jgi:murein DD-endopeptidase MepM/ murein hydrolase activator NlpD